MCAGRKAVQYSGNIDLCVSCYTNDTSRRTCTLAITESCLNLLGERLMGNLRLSVQDGPKFRDSVVRGKALSLDECEHPALRI